MLAAPDGQLRAMTSSSEAMRVVELFELQSQEGPCLECFHIGQPVVNQDLTTVNGRWPRFALAQALADIATIAILRNRVIVETQVLNEQLAFALSSRIVIEKARGMIAERQRLPIDQAFERLRRHARRYNLRLADLARDTVNGDVDPTTFASFAT
jgi:ANTAR domain